MMDVRIGLISLLVLGAAWAGVARELAVGEVVVSDISDLQMRNTEFAKESKSLDGVVKNDQICTLCEQFTAQALGYLKENKTETEVLDALHKSCSRVPTFEKQCITLVDYYAPLFFLEISTIQPDQFCRKMNLCQKVAAIYSQVKEDTCVVCHRVVSELTEKLKDPDTQLEIIEVLLKACNSIENHAKQCKTLVFEYGPVILANGEKFLESTDLCTLLHACKQGSKELVADS